MTQCVLIVDDDPIQLDGIESVIRERLGCQTLTAPSAEAAIEHFLLRMSPRPHLILVSLSGGETNSAELTRRIRRADAHIPVVVLAPQGNHALISAAVRSGASDILIKPAHFETLRLSIQNLLKQSNLERELERLQQRSNHYSCFDDLVSNHPSMQSVIREATMASASLAPVLLQGERATGKETLALCMHSRSEQKNYPFVSINCASESQTLLETLLQAMPNNNQSGATTDIPGLDLLLQKGRGSLLLKHVEYLTPQMQSTLTDLLKNPPADHPLNGIRIFASCCTPLKLAMQSGQFREDLFFIFSKIMLHLPSLQERSCDIIGLSEHFIRRATASDHAVPCQIRSDARQLLNNYLWPGNINELARVIARSLLHCDGTTLQAHHIAPHLNANAFRNTDALIYDRPQQGFDMTELSLFNLDGNIKPIEQVEAEIIRAAIAHYNGKMTEVAKRLGIGRSTLYRKMQDYKLNDAA